MAPKMQGKVRSNETGYISIFLVLSNYVSIFLLHSFNQIASFPVFAEFIIQTEVYY